MMKLSTAVHRRVTRSPAIIVVCGVVIGLAGPAPPVRDFMSYDAAERLVELTVVARYDESNAGFNLNGGVRGSHRIIVPVGWRVHVRFFNSDVIPHSLGLAREGKLVPIRIEKPALPGAATRSILAGVRARDNDDFAFVATLPGSYLLACGVPGHAANGSYLRFEISSGTTVPSYETTTAVAMADGRD